METSAALIPFSRFPARWLLVLDEQIVQKRGPGLAYVPGTGETIAVAATKGCRELPDHPCPGEGQPWGEHDPETIWETASLTDQSATSAESGILAPIHCI